MKKGNKAALAGLAVLLLLVLVLGGAYLAAWPDAVQGEKTITVAVVHRDGTEVSHTYTTDGEYLGEVLLAEGLIQGEAGPYGLYVQTVDGERAVYEEDGSYWALYQGEEYAATGIDQTPIEDGDCFSLVCVAGGAE